MPKFLPKQTFRVYNTNPTLKVSGWQNRPAPWTFWRNAAASRSAAPGRKLQKPQKIPRCLKNKLPLPQRNVPLVKGGSGPTGFGRFWTVFLRRLPCCFFLSLWEWETQLKPWYTMYTVWLDHFSLLRKLGEIRWLCEWNLPNLPWSALTNLHMNSSGEKCTVMTLVGGFSVHLSASFAARKKPWECSRKVICRNR